MRVFYDERQTGHDPHEPHTFNGAVLPPAENAARATRIIEALAAAGIGSPERPDPIDDGTLGLVHTERYLSFLRTAHERWRAETGGAAGGEAVPYIRPIPGHPWREPRSVLAQLGRFSFDVDPILAHTWEAARASAATAVTAAAAVASGEAAAYALCRPPGHHAAPEAFGGYCYLNNAAIAAAWLAARGARVGLLDVDAHHGNGTQAVFWERADVVTVSIHGDPAVHFPFFGGFGDERGAGAGEGAHLNLPLPTGTDWTGYADALAVALDTIRATRPDVLVVSLGVDTDVVDGVLALHGDDFGRVGGAIAAVGSPTVFVQEGGYGPGVLERNVGAVLAGFLGS